MCSDQSDRVLLPSTSLEDARPAGGPVAAVPLPPATNAGNSELATSAGTDGPPSQPAFSGSDTEFPARAGGDRQEGQPGELREPVVDRQSAAVSPPTSPAAAHYEALVAQTNMFLGAVWHLAHAAGMASIDAGLRPEHCPWSIGAPRDAWFNGRYQRYLQQQESA